MSPKNNLNSPAPTYLPIFKKHWKTEESRGGSTTHVGCNLSY